LPLIRWRSSSGGPEHLPQRCKVWHLRSPSSRDGVSFW
jgi:hypothetical protein